MIYSDGNFFVLQTASTAYAFRKIKSGHLEHLHYGAALLPKSLCDKIDAGEIPAGKDKEIIENTLHAIAPKHFFGGGNMNTYSDEFSDVFLEQLCLETSSLGKGDIRDPMVELVYHDGSETVDFVYESHEIREGKRELENLPSSYADKYSGSVSELVVTMRDREYGAVLELTYSVFPGCDCIVRSAAVINDSDKDIRIKRLLSTCVDFDRTGYRFTSFHGRWADEMGKHESLCTAGKVVCEEIAAGESGSRSNPFVMVSEPETDENAGECYGFNLVYSGNHYEALSANGSNMSRFMTGIQPVGFSWLLAPGEKFTAPEAVMTYSCRGFNGMSLNMHRFVRKHIVRGRWRDKQRPILINSWEANYFNFTQGSLISLAKEAKKCGIELFVMDDGWFGHRNDDKSSLGDWYENRKKLPGGIKELSDKIAALDMLFGIWVEPEMVNEDSELYKAHPDWAVTVPGHPHSKGRNQMNLDLSRTEVQDYVIDSMKKVFSAGKISYVKWDMNRIFSDRYSRSLEPDRQGEFMHRYYLGLYRIMKELTESFPEILFEGCSAGGGRFDLGVLCYFPQIWGSDDTDAMCRIDIQRGYSYGYPTSCIGAHVSACPNHQTLNNSTLETRFEVAAAGCFGYELNLGEISDSDRKAIADQVAFYKEWREVFQFGDYYRLADDGYMIVAPDRSRAVAFAVERSSRPNNDYRCIKCAGLDDDTLYSIKNRVAPISLLEFGSLVNNIAPIHIKQDGIIHHIIDKVVNFSGEEQKETALGRALNGHGLALNPSFSGTGYNGDVRIQRSGESRLYMFESVRN